MANQSRNDRRTRKHTRMDARRREVAERYLKGEYQTEIAAAESPYFPDIDEAVLAKCIASYQDLGTWTPHVEITEPAFEVILDVLEHFGTLKERYSWDQICAAPPSD